MLFSPAEPPIQGVFAADGVGGAFGGGGLWWRSQFSAFSRDC